MVLAEAGGRGLAVAAMLAAASAGLLAWQWWDGLSFLAFADEATHVLGGRMLAEGGVLYRDFVDTHGPLVFALAQGGGAVFGWSRHNDMRWLQVLCGIAAIGSCAASAVPRDRLARCCLLLLACGLLASIWLRQGLYLLSFYPLGGALTSVGLSGIVFGACTGRWPGRLHAMLAGLALVLLVGVAYSFLPTLSLLVLAVGWAALRDTGRRVLLPFGSGILAGLSAMALYMLRFADLHGYLSYHFAENQFVYARYIGFSWRQFAASLLPSIAPAARAQTVGVLCVALSLPLFVAGGGRRGPFGLAALGVLALNARGAANFQDGSFLWAAITLLALSASHAAGAMRASARSWAASCCAGLVLATLLFLRGALFLPFAFPPNAMAAMPRWPIGDRSDAPLFAAIRRYARPDERILGLLYQPQLYLLADRLPMDGFYAWFPWDQDYAREARFGRGRDLCRALEDRPPPVIVLDPSPMWDHAPTAVVPCLPEILRARYAADTAISDLHGTLFVRRDRFREVTGSN